jgi:LysR family transcriptional regulator, transcriptional activator AphB
VLSETIDFIFGIMLDDIVLFIQIVRRGGLSGAAQHLGIPPATVTRRLQNLEKELGCQLLHRSARQFALTQEGEIYYQSYADLVEDFEITQQQLNQELKQLSGKLRVLAPTNFSLGALRPMWLAFTRQYPDIQLELILSNQMEDMAKTKADIAIRIGPQPDSLLYQTKLGQMETILVASSDYFNTTNEPSEPSDLQGHRIIGTTLRLKWQLTHKESKATQEVFPRFSALSNDLTFVKYWVLDNQGIALLPAPEIKSELSSGAVVRVLPHWQGHTREIYAVWPSGRLLNEKAKCLREHVKQFITDILM